MSAQAYYFLTLSVAITMFFLAWGIMIEIQEPAPFVKAGVFSGLLMVFAVIVREAMLKRALRKRIEDAEMLDRTWAGLEVKGRVERKKLSIEQNDEIVEDLFLRSDSARSLPYAPEQHWELFVRCDKYLRMTRREISRTHINSPRLSPINRSRGSVKKLHKYHLLRWARESTSDLEMDPKFFEHTYAARMEKARSAESSLSTALRFYPREKELSDSHDAVLEYISMLQISYNLGVADLAFEDKDYSHAKRVFENVLTSLDDENISTVDRNRISENVEVALRKIRAATRSLDS